jgi:transcription elongation GreA/GreB family factor
LSKKELEFIESELATVGRSNEAKKIVEAAGAVAASINAKYEDAKKELEIIKVALARTKEEHENTKKELESLKKIINTKNITM